MQQQTSPYRHQQATSPFDPPMERVSQTVMPSKEAEVAGFLLSLKHGEENRSVTPELPSRMAGGRVKNDSTPSKRRYHRSHAPHPRDHPDGGYHPSYAYSSYGYDAPSQMEQSSPYADDSDHRLAMTLNPDDMPWEILLDGSTLVLQKDRELVPDALFVAMAQMKPCRLTIPDRVGCYKNRELGFLGMCCKHCGGQPGFGRYYPNSVRSLAQTTTSQTILKHVSLKCRYCPPEIRDAIQELQRQQAIREGAATGRPRYGSRKVFFQRVWTRLHGGIPEGDDDCTAASGSVATNSKHHDDDSNHTPSDLDEESTSLGCSISTDSIEQQEPVKFTNKRKTIGYEMEGKRVKVTSPHHRLSADD